MSQYTEFFLRSKRSVVQLELVDITHPNFTQGYRYVRNSAAPVQVTLEDASTQTYTYLPMSIKQKAIKDDLDIGFEIQLGDVGEGLEKEIEALRLASLNDPATGFAIKPTVTYRQYRSDALSSPMLGPIKLEMRALSYNQQGAAFTASTPQLNVNKTGELYTLDRFPMLLGFSSFSTYYSPPSYLDFISGTEFDLVNSTRFELEN